jgi:putative glutamine amidotransferase
VGKPVVGITTYLTRAAWGVWDADAALVPVDYVRAVEAAGGAPLLVPPGADTDATLGAVDGLIFSGGSDLDPELYGDAPHPETNGVVRERDDFELGLMRAALERDVPVLAICRGSQVLNVALGGGIEQHVPDRVGSDVHKQTPGVFAEHDVDVLAGTRLESLLGAKHDVKSHHHQGFGALGAGLREAARAPDGTVEALEEPSRRFALGVLWHPEAGGDLALFTALVAEAAAYRATRATKN